MKKKLIITIAFIFLLVQSVSAQNKVPKIQQSGICNGLATYLPKPEQPKPSAVNVSGVINVQIAIDKQGDVVSANAVSGHPLLRPLAEKAALKAKFRQTTFSGNPVKVNCSIVYNFVREEPIQIKQSEILKGKPIVDLPVGIVIGKAIKLARPPFPSCNCKFSNNYKTIVQFTVDEKGSVESATAISGHPVLKYASVAAIRNSKFSISRIAREPVKAFGLIIYDYVLTKNKRKSRVVKYELKLDKSELNK